MSGEEKEPGRIKKNEGWYSPGPSVPKPSSPGVVSKIAYASIPQTILAAADLPSSAPGSSEDRNQNDG